MKKPTVCLDTSIISAYWDRSKDLSAAARRVKTREWWKYERQYFKLWTSVVAESELRTGRFPHQAECLRMVSRIRYLVIDRTVAVPVDELLARWIVPHLSRCQHDVVRRIAAWGAAGTVVGSWGDYVVGSRSISCTACSSS